MLYERLILGRDGAVATITLNHPESRNCLSWKMANELNDALDQLGDARALIITGAGKGFCSGGDMSSTVREGSDFGEMLYEGLTKAVNPMLLKLRGLNIPVISAINGAAAGAGAPFALSADICIAAESAFFYLAFPNMGLVPDSAASWLLPRLVGKARAFQLMLLAERIPAAQALDWGMIYQVVPDDQLQAAAQALAAKLAAGPTLAYGLIRQQTWAAMESDYASALGLEADNQSIAGKSKDCSEAVSAFFDKRPPVFRGE